MPFRRLNAFLKLGDLSGVAATGDLGRVALRRVLPIKKKIRIHLIKDRKRLLISRL